MKLNPRLVLNAWRQAPNWRPTFRDLVRELSTPRNQTADLRSLLEHLVDEGKLTRDHLRYQLPPVPLAPTRKRRPTEALEGVFSAHRDGFGFVAFGNDQPDWFVPPGNVGGALDGDRVRVTAEPGRGRGPTARVVAVVERRRQAVRGRLFQEDGHWWLLPLNERIPSVYVDRFAQGLAGKLDALAEARLTAFPEDAQTAPVGEVVSLFADSNAPADLVDHILFDLGIRPAFPEAVEAEAARFPTEVAAERPAGRMDLRDFPFVTIDGASARDFDDAVCMLPLPHGHSRLLVAIADVSHYVTPGSALDSEAYLRGTSVYLPGRVVPMLPETLSNDLCSLKPGVPRLVLTCDLELNARGDPVRYSLYPSLIASRARLTYDQVQQGFTPGDGAALPPAELIPMLADMRALAVILRRKRRARGALALEFPEAQVQLDPKGRPTAVLKVFPTDATGLIEQFMLEANEAVARHCADHEIPILYRVHDPPPPAQLQDLREWLWNLGVATPGEGLAAPGGMNTLLNTVARHPLREQIHFAVVRTMAQAQYRESNTGHYGLAAPHYAHFTSPIRRYPDLLLHRHLKASLARKAKRPGFPGGAGLHLSLLERRAGEAESKAVKLYKAVYMEPFLGEEFDGVVTGVSAAGAWVELADHNTEGLLATEAMGTIHYRFDRRRQLLEATRGRHTVGPGTKVRVQLVRVTREAQAIELGLVRWAEAPLGAPPQTRARRPGRGGKGRRG